MIPKNVREGAQAANLPGERQAFTILANGKAFRSLIDTLYSNKILAVIRELSSNAADSHIDAGNAAPFLVQIPTTLDPTFRVRDYGVGLSHEDVMHLYTEVFRSTKEGTNAQTGALGLGSKSPFAYTDSFQVTTWDGTTARQYLTLLETDGVPSIVHVDTFPSTEPRGLEVQFAAKREDIRQFQKEMQFVSLGYDHDAKPTVEGMDLKIPQPRLKGNGWAIYPRGSFGDELRHSHYIRQGSAVYPNEQIPFPHLGYGWISVVTVPIGTADVTSSRDALSYDRDTRDAVSLVLRGAHEELKRQIDSVLAAAKTRIEKARVYSQYNGVLDNLRGSTVVSLELDGERAYDANHNLIQQPGTVVESAKFWGKAQSTSGRYRSQSGRWCNGLEYTEIERFRLLVNDTETKVVRRMKRIRSMDNNRTYVLDESDLVRRAAGLKNIIKCFELKPEQIILVSSIPDDPPAKRTTGKAPRRVLAAGQFWMPRHQGRVVSEIFGESDRGIGEWPTKMRQAAATAGVSFGDVFFVTEVQQAAHVRRNELPDDRRLDVVIQKKLEAKIKAMPVDDALTYKALMRTVGEYNKAMPVVLASFFPTLTITQTQADEILKIAEMAQIDLRTRPIVAKVDAEINNLINQYPLLFQRSDRKHYEHYIEAVQAAKTNPAALAQP